MKQIFILLSFLFLSFNLAEAQVTVSKNSLDHAFARNVKSLDEFIARFNGDEFHPDVPDGSLKRITNILSLIDPAIKAPGKTPAKEYVTVFAEKSSDWGGRLSLLSDNVWADVNCTFAIDKKNLPLSILLKQEKKANGQIRWAIVGVSGLTEAGILEDRYITISPADHELNFMSFGDLFNSNASLTPGLRSASKDIDQLSMFFGLSYTGKLKFKSVEKLRYHFLDIPGYIFTVEASNRPEDVGGWRIADIMMAGEFDKMDYINSLYGYK